MLTLSSSDTSIQEQYYLDFEYNFWGEHAASISQFFKKF